MAITCLALEAVAGAATMLVGRSFDDVVRTAPALVLDGVPGARRVELVVTRVGHAEPLVVSADQEQQEQSRSTRACAEVVLDVAVPDCGAVGRLAIATTAPRHLLQVATMTAELMAIQVELALDLAHTKELNQDLHSLLRTARDSGIVRGLLMGDGDLSEQALLELFRELAHETGDAPAPDLLELDPPPESKAPNLRLL
ncbi:hypothetical protein ASC58_14535 [Phycicoccus sp. Root101]|nr:hypothetical protein ASC58_14535 [Phycicoccus sp. Root101]